MRYDLLIESLLVQCWASVSQHWTSNDSMSRACLFATHFEYDVLVCVEEAKVAGGLKRVKAGVEQVRGEGGQHTAEEDHPSQLHTPEGAHLLHGEQEPSYRSPERSGHSGSGSRCGEITPETQTHAMMKLVCTKCSYNPLESLSLTLTTEGQDLRSCKSGCTKVWWFL